MCPVVGIYWLCPLLCMCTYTWGGLILRPGVLRSNTPGLEMRIRGTFNLNHIWDRVLLNTPSLKISPPQVYAHNYNNGHNQSIPINGHLQVNIGYSGHGLNSEYVLRGS